MQTVVIVPVSSNHGNRAVRYNSAISHVLGGLQVTVGALCVILNIVGLLKQIRGPLFFPGALFFIGHGIWGGIFFIITGAIGIGAGCTKNKCLIIGFMVLSILSASVFTVPMVAMDSIAINTCNYDIHHFPYYQMRSDYLWRSAVVESRKLHIGMLTLTLIELIVAVCSSVLCCKAVCGCCKTNSELQQEQSMMTNQYSLPPGTVQYIIQPGGSAPPATVQHAGQQGAPPGSQYVTQPAGAQYVAPPTVAPSAPPPYVSQYSPGAQNEAFTGTMNKAREAGEDI